MYKRTDTVKTSSLSYRIPDASRVVFGPFTNVRFIDFTGENQGPYANCLLRQSS